MAKTSNALLLSILLSPAVSQAMDGSRVGGDITKFENDTIEQYVVIGVSNELHLTCITTSPESKTYHGSFWRCGVWEDAPYLADETSFNNLKCMYKEYRQTIERRMIATVFEAFSKPIITLSENADFELYYVNLQNGNPFTCAQIKTGPHAGEFDCSIKFGRPGTNEAFFSYWKHRYQEQLLAASDKAKK